MDTCSRMPTRRPDRCPALVWALVALGAACGDFDGLDPGLGGAPATEQVTPRLTTATNTQALATGFRYFGYYWVSSPPYGDYIDDVKSFTNLMMINPPAAGGYDAAYISKVNLSGSKLIADVTACFWDCPGMCTMHADYEGLWAHCKATWLNRLRRQNIYAFYIADEGLERGCTREQLAAEIALLKRDFPEVRTVLTGHAVPRDGESALPAGLDVFSISISCYWSVGDCQANYAEYRAGGKMPSFAGQQLVTIGAFHNPDRREYAAYSVGEQAPYMAWALDNPLFSGMLVFLYPNVGTMQGVQGNPEIKEYHRQIGLSIMCANTWESDPVCGSNDVTYQNADLAKCAGAGIARYGPCCTSECSPGEARCVGDTPQPCVEVNGCWVWSQQLPPSCPASAWTTDPGHCEGNRVVRTVHYDYQTCQQGACVSSPTTVNETVAICDEPQICEEGRCQCPPSPCAAGETRCEGQRIWYCADSNGCLGWAAYEDCPANHLCQEGQCVACPDACSVGETRCLGDAPQRCLDQGGCGSWVQGAVCDTGAVACAGGSVVRTRTCDRACQAGVYVEGPVTETEVVQACGGNQVCQDGACVCPPPVCTPGQTSCEDDTVRTCVEVDGCAAWTPPAQCPPGQTCQGDRCAPIDHMCSLRQRRCQGAGVAICVERDGRRVWGEPIPCPQQGQTCEDGLCVAPPTVDAGERDPDPLGSADNIEIDEGLACRASGTASSWAVGLLALWARRTRRRRGR